MRFNSLFNKNRHFYVSACASQNIEVAQYYMNEIESTCFLLFVKIEKNPAVFGVPA